MGFRRGTFVALRATTRIHLGQHEIDIFKDDIIHFDGQTVKIGDDSYSAPRLRQAYDEGWLVDEDDWESEYQPRPAGIKVSPATHADADEDERIEMGMAHNEERVVSSRAASNASRNRRNAGGGRKASMQLDSDDLHQEGVTVGRLSSPKKSTKVTDAGAARRAERALDDGRIERAQPVQRGRGGRTVEEVIPGVATTPRPSPGRAGEGDDPHLTPSERRERRLASLRAQLAKEEAAAAAADAVEADDDDAAEPPGDKELAAAKLAGIQAVMPDFDWDLDDHWRRRVSRALEFQDDEQWLNAILAIETATVVKHIKKQLAA